MSSRTGILSYYHVLALCIGMLTCLAVYNAVKISSNTARIDVIEDLYRRSSDRWTGSDHRAWASELQRRNEDIDVPVMEHGGTGKP